MFTIVDLDNCISKDDWRYKFILHQKSDMFARYKDYHLLAGFDEPRNLDLILDREIIVFTARPVYFRPITELWLEKHVARYANIAALLMRNDNDHRPSAVLKHAMLLQLKAFWGIELSEIQWAIDDREDVVEMYNRMGLAASVVAISREIPPGGRR